jgi:hypothetical protein
VERHTDVAGPWRPRDVDWNAGPINQLNAVEDETNQAVGHRFAEVMSIPLEQIPFRGEMLGFGVRWVTADHRDCYHASL